MGKVHTEYLLMFVLTNLPGPLLQYKRLNLVLKRILYWSVLF